MKKRILITIGALVLLVILVFGYMNYRSRKISPQDQISYKDESLTMEISYSKPTKRGRLIFGTEEQGALLPYGKYWRLGANEATEISFDRNVLFNGIRVAKGRYRMYAVPGEREFVVVLNSALGKWGYSEPDYDLDVAKTTVPVERVRNPVEQFTIRFEDLNPAVLIVFEWENISFKVPVESQSGL